MGKPKKGGFPPVQPKTYYIDIAGDAMQDTAVAWGDSIVFSNKDAQAYKVVSLTGGTPGMANGTPDPTLQWADLGPVNSQNANSQAIVFTWQPGLSKDPVYYPVGTIPGSAKALVTVQASVPAN